MQLAVLQKQMELAEKQMKLADIQMQNEEKHSQVLQKMDNVLSKIEENPALFIAGAAQLLHGEGIPQTNRNPQSWQQSNSGPNVITEYLGYQYS